MYMYATTAEITIHLLTTKPRVKTVGQSRKTIKSVIVPFAPLNTATQDEKVQDVFHDFGAPKW